MPPVASFMLGAFAVFMMRTLVRALRNGIIFSDGVPYNFKERPSMFASTAAIHGSGALLFAWLAVNGHIAGLWSLIGTH
jgi:hypothetical protein